MVFSCSNWSIPGLSVTAKSNKFFCRNSKENQTKCESLKASATAMKATWSYDHNWPTKGNIRRASVPAVLAILVTSKLCKTPGPVAQNYSKRKSANYFDHWPYQKSSNPSHLAGAKSFCPAISWCQAHNCFAVYFKRGQYSVCVCEGCTPGFEDFNILCY